MEQKKAPKKKIRKALILVPAALITFFLLLWFFGYRYAPSAIAVRRYLAGKIADTERHDSVRKIYTDIIRYDESREDSYLEIAAYEEEWLDTSSHAPAWNWVTRGITACGKTSKLVKRATLLAHLNADDLLAEEEYEAALVFLEEALKYGVSEEDMFLHFREAYRMKLARYFDVEDYTAVADTFEALKENYREEDELRFYYLQSYPLLIRSLIREKDAEAALYRLEMTPEELAESDEIRYLTIEARLLHAKQLIAEGNEDAALQEILTVMELSPENEIARVLYLQLIGTEAETAVAPDPVDSFTAEGVLTLHMNAGAFLVTTPLEIEAPVRIEMSGLAGEEPVLSYSLDAEAEVLGNTESFSLSDTVSGNGEAVSQLKEAYVLLSLGAVTDGEITEIDGIPCLVYTYQVEQGDLSDLGQALEAVFLSEDDAGEFSADALQLVHAEVKRYISEETGDPVRIEADLSGTDLAAMLTPYIGEELPTGTTLSGDSAELFLDISGIRRQPVTAEKRSF